MAITKFIILQFPLNFWLNCNLNLVGLYRGPLKPTLRFIVGDKKAIVDGILYFIQNPKDLSIFGERNQQNVFNNFSLNIFAEKFESELF